jgi:hypothetical protein
MFKQAKNVTKTAQNRRREQQNSSENGFHLNQYNLLPILTYAGAFGSNFRNFANYRGIFQIFP